MLRTSSRFDLKKKKKIHRKWPQIDLLRISTKPGFPKRRDKRSAEEAGGCEEEEQSTNAASERELERREWEDKGKESDAKGAGRRGGWRGGEGGSIIFQ